MSADGTAATQERRKACDLCFKKKIKCDMITPICSNCILYGADCRTTSIARRKAGVAKARPSVKAQLHSAEEENESLKARLSRIESQLQEVLEATKSQHKDAQAQFQPKTSNSSSSPEESVYSCASDTRSHLWKFDPVEPILYNGPSDEGLPLGPLENLMPAVDHYFNTFNQVLPIFDQRVFMRTLTGWYNNTIKKDRATWAAILMVCASGLRSPVPGEAATGEQASKQEWANYCMRNAQSVMSDLVTREHDLIGIQVLISLGLQFHNSSDSRAAGVLIGTALRLGHRLRLHSGDSAQYYPADEVLQRNRVFWIAYQLDKDISLRTKAPSSQADADIDIPLPPLNPPDGIGIIWTKDGSTKLNIFRMRIDLAHIQGKIYDLLYSNRALKIQGAERHRRVASLSTMLDQWYNRLPTLFRLEHVGAAVGESELVQMVKLHHTHLHAFVHINGVYSHHADWLNKISSLSRAAIQDFATSMQGPSSACSSEYQDPPAGEAWDRCVEMSRGCMRLFQETTPTECLIWQCACAHFSGLIILLANNLVNPKHPLVSLDQQIAGRGVGLLNDILAVIDRGPFDTLQRLILDLYKTSNKAVDQARLEQATAGSDMFATENDSSINPFESEIGFPEFVDLEGNPDFTGTLEMDGLFGPFVDTNDRGMNILGLPTDFQTTV